LSIKSVTIAALAVGAVSISSAGLAHADVTPGPQPVSPALHAVASNAENNDALSAFSTSFGLAVAVGGFIGTGIGAGIGCIAGLPAAGIGCIPGALVGAPIGALIGTLVIGGPVLIGTGIDYVNTLNAAPGTSRWADN